MVVGCSKSCLSWKRMCPNPTRKLDPWIQLIQAHALPRVEGIGPAPTLSSALRSSHTRAPCSHVMPCSSSLCALCDRHALQLELQHPTSLPQEPPRFLTVLVALRQRQQRSVVGERGWGADACCRDLTRLCASQVLYWSQTERLSWSLELYTTRRGPAPYLLSYYGFKVK